MHTKSMLTLREISILTEPALGHLCYLLTDVPPKPNSPPDTIFDLDQPHQGATISYLQLLCSLLYALAKSNETHFPSLSLSQVRRHACVKCHSSGIVHFEGLMYLHV